MEQEAQPRSLADIQPNRDQPITEAGMAKARARLNAAKKKIDPVAREQLVARLRATS